MARINLYGQNRHTLVIDGFTISSFAEGDFIQVKQDGNVAARSLGADGPSMNLSTTQGGNVTVSLLPTSPVMGIMYSIRKQQEQTPRLFNMVLLSGVDELVNFNGCAFGEQPQWVTGGPIMQPRQFSFECLEILMDQSATITLA